jgi:hypothetical protein
MFGARVLDSRPETAGIQPFRQTLDISPSLNSEASPPLILSGDNFLRPSEFEAGFQPNAAQPLDLRSGSVSMLCGRPQGNDTYK